MSAPSVPADLVRRPDTGTLGRPFRIKSNFFEITNLPQVNVHHYDVVITPDVPPTINRKVFAHFVEKYQQSELGGVRPVFDGRHNMFTAKRLPFDAKTFEVTLPEAYPSSRGGTSKPPRVFQFKLKKSANINLYELRDFLDGRAGLSNNCRTAMMALDVLIRHKPSFLYSNIGRSFYIPDGSQALNGGVEVWQGYHQSVRPVLGRMMINIDVAAAVYYQAGPLLNLVIKILGRQGLDDLRRPLVEKDRARLERTLRGLQVQVTHRSDNPRPLKIMRVTSTSARQTMFTKDSVSVDVFTYFERTYGRRLLYPHLPCVTTSKGAAIPIELCSVVPGQPHFRKLNEKQTADMLRFTCKPPHIRANKIREGLRILNFHENEYLLDFGVRVANEMADVRARQLDPPTISYNPASRDANFIPHNGTWNLRDKKVAAGAVLGSWSAVVFGNERDLPIVAAQGFIRELVVVCQDTGLDVVNKRPPIIYADPHGDIEGTLKQAWLRAGNAVKAPPQLLFCFLPNTGLPLYAEIKRVSDTVIGISTQCVQMSHARNPKKQYCANVCLKMNVKLGGMNSFLPPAQTPFLSQKPTILFGADVSHPTPGDHVRPSIASLVGSMDAKAAHYAATVRVQTARTETIADLGGMVVELLKTFYQTCGQKPERILFYRDGVSDSQFAEILRSEVTSVKAACLALEKTYRPTITFVVVQKRHRVRFFPIRPQDADKIGNCKAGTVIDTDVVHPSEFDFYLQSHASLQGTSRPTHYHVLYDENNFRADELQDFTYKLCHLYARCTRTVSVVPPAAYAHIVAARARFHAQGEDWDEMTNTSREGGADGSAGGASAATTSTATADNVSEAGSTATAGQGSSRASEGRLLNPSGGAGEMGMYLAVKPDLMRVMYFM
ncbi:Eukaryotic translation initiation factor 2C [Actinomortierella ambigua]|nr:Eukaryotic translation initiation factor 2C [Actinomortierella ambigua]